MNPNHNSNDNQCQLPAGCIQSFFTYCPHCHLFLCIHHLNEHHDAMKIDIHQRKYEAENHRVLLEQQTNKMKQQQILLNDLHEREIKNLNDIHQFITNICENSYLFISEYEQVVKYFVLIKQNQRNNPFILQVDQMLQQQNHITVPSESCTKEELSVDSIIDCHSNELSIGHHNDSDSNTSSLKSEPSTNPVHRTCPLSHVNALGFSLSHNIPGVPCNYLKASTPLTDDRCYYHLISSHRLRQSVARLIIKTISSNENKTLDLTALDMFSHWKSNDILSQGTSLFIGQCPLI